MHPPNWQILPGRRCLHDAARRRRRGSRQCASTLARQVPADERYEHRRRGDKRLKRGAPCMWFPQRARVFVIGSDEVPQRHQVDEQVAAGGIAQRLRQPGSVEGFVIEKRRNDAASLCPSCPLSRLAAGVPHWNRSSCCDGRRQLRAQLKSSAMDARSDSVRREFARPTDLFIAKAADLPHEEDVAIQVGNRRALR